MRVVLTWTQVQNEIQIQVGSPINPTQTTHMKYGPTGHSESTQTTMMLCMNNSTTTVQLKYNHSTIEEQVYYGVMHVHALPFI